MPPRTPRAGSVRPLTPLTAFRRPHLVVVAAIVAMGLLVAGWAVLRARPVAVAVTPPVGASVPAGAPSGAPSGAPTAAPVDPGSSTGPRASVAGVVVHVLGAVRKPGLVTLTTGSRVQDAIAAAGGLAAKADPGELNLAQAVTDGQQIVVGTKNKPAGEVRNGTAGGSEGGGAVGPGAGGSGTGSGRPLDLNTATQAELEELPGVGPVMAGKILAWRTENGRFSRVEELQEIDGVGPKTYAKLAPLCRV
ncbi:MAG TPA: helix-hairpin-helix domain-containing protein [Microlunatus sp.]|nr:helix-hairpin-helix domain-containing protein [Microlunatus sp.]